MASTQFRRTPGPHFVKRDRPEGDKPFRKPERSGADHRPARRDNDGAPRARTDARADGSSPRPPRRDSKPFATRSVRPCRPAPVRRGRRRAQRAHRQAAGSRRHCLAPRRRGADRRRQGQGQRRQADVACFQCQHVRQDRARRRGNPADRADTAVPVPQARRRRHHQPRSRGPSHGVRRAAQGPAAADDHRPARHQHGRTAAADQ